MQSLHIHRFLPIVALLALAALPIGAGAAESTGTGSAASGKVKSTLASGDKKFVKDAAESQLAILHLTELTRRPEQPGSEELKKFTTKLGTDLNTAWGELGTAAQAKGAELPKTDVAASEKTTLDKLKKTDADKFDKAFLKVFTKESKKAAQVLEMGEKNVKDAELKAFAQKWAPALKTANEEAEKMETDAAKKK